MSLSLVREKWPLGWTPSADDTGGDPNGLLRADNLKLDELGALTLGRGFKNLNATQFPGYVHSIYSTDILNIKHRFVGLSTGQVLHASDGVTFSDEILNEGNPARARFSDVFGSIFVSSGAKRKKYDGTNTFNWGLETPKTQVGMNVFNQPKYDVSGADGSGDYGPWQMVEGANFGTDTTGAHVDNDPTTLRAIIGVIYQKDWSAFPAGGIGTDSDVFSFRVKLGDSNHVDRIRVEIGLGTITDLNNMENYYWFEWQHDVDQTPFTEGADSYSTLQCTRGDFQHSVPGPRQVGINQNNNPFNNPGFQRVGTDATLGWKNVGAIRVTFICNDTSLDNSAVGFTLTGSSLGPLNNSYEYAQVNVRDNGTYVGKSALSPKQSVGPIQIINGYATVTPAAPSDPQINQIWIYRRGGLLQAFYRIGVIRLNLGTYQDSMNHISDFHLGGAITDICTDEAAQDLNEIANEATISVADIPDEFLCIIEGLYFERVVICTVKEILITERLNPDAIDNAHRLSVSGDKTEQILWIARLSNALSNIGTTKNRYELSGTLVDNPDGTIDANIRALGEKHPPLGLEFALDSNSIIYMAEDGWRITDGGPSQILNPQLDQLYKGSTRYGLAPVQLGSSASIVYPVAVYKGQVVTSNACVDGSRPLFIYDLKLNYWRLVEANPICLFVELDGTLIGGFGDPNDFYLKQLDIGDTIDTQGVTKVGQRIYFQTVYDNNQQPRNRKEAYMLKLLIDTGGVDVNVYVSGDNGGWAGVGVVNTPFLQEVYLDLYKPLTKPFGLGFRFGVRITSTGYNLKVFRLAQLTIEYDARPELVTTLRIQPTNLGSYARKRVTNFAFAIDTLGYDVIFQPIIDTVEVGTPLTINHSIKQTAIYYFTSETIGTDFGGLLTATENDTKPVNTNNRGVFEFYGVNTEEIVSEKLPTPVKYLKIPANDYGSPNRKRHSSYKFQINTNGQDVQFTPILDGTAKTPATFNTPEKRTVEYFFTSDTASIDIGGTLTTLADTPFEFYGVVIPQKIELLPPRLRELYIPETNYGIAAKKRIRTMPMEINTNGHNVTFTPIVDGIAGTPSLLNTPTRKTAFHYFTTDVFGVDFAGELTGSFPFEFYDLLKPETVEILPVSKRFDQVGPTHLARVGKLVGFRIRVITGEANLPWIIYAEDEAIASGTIITTPNVDDVYEVEFITKGRIAVISRMEIGPSLPFNRYYVEFKVNLGGNDNQIKLLRISDAFAMSQMIR